MPRLKEVRKDESVWETDIAENKTALLKAQFFPKEADANLSNINNYYYPQSVEQLPQVIIDMVSDVISKHLSFSASGTDGIPNVFLKAISESFI